MMQSVKRSSDMSPFPLVPRGGNGDREEIAVGAGLCDDEGERAYTGYDPHFSF